LWSWGIDKVVCLGLGSFRHVKAGTGPFVDDEDKGKTSHTYRDVIRDKDLVEEFNAGEVDRHDPLQAMLRHVAAIEMASMVKFCSSKRGIEHDLIKHYFKKRMPHPSCCCLFSPFCCLRSLDSDIDGVG
jgi:hypothetical protein